MPIQLLIVISQWLGQQLLSYGLTKSLDRLIRRQRTSPNRALSGQASTLIPDIHGIEALKALLKEHRYKFNELTALFNSEADLRAILREEEDLSAEDIQKLADYFHISPLVFLERQPA